MSNVLKQQLTKEIPTLSEGDFFHVGMTTRSLLGEDQSGFRVVDYVAKSEEWVQRRKVLPFSEVVENIIQLGSSRYKRIYTASQPTSSQFI